MSNRLERIKTYSNKQKEIEEHKTTLFNHDVINYIEDIHLLHDRIKELIDTANECIKYGIDINTYKSKGYYRHYDSYEKGTFVTNGISHRLGFVLHPSDKKIRYIGILNGGYNGIYDLRTNGGFVEYVNHSDSSDVRSPYDNNTPNIRDLKKLLYYFDGFESEFYKYVDSIIG